MYRDESSRQFPKCMPSDWVPPVPAWSGLMPYNGQLTVAYYGVQSPLGPNAEGVAGFRSWLATSLSEAGDAVHCEFANYIDVKGCYTWLCIGYWVDETQHARWSASPAHQDYWEHSTCMDRGIGVFREVLSIPADRFETLQSDKLKRTGASRVCPVLHGPIREHNYWGATRDRIAASGYDPLMSEAQGATSDAVEGITLGRRVNVRAPHNLAIIRSGQVLEDLEGLEKQIYFNEIEPALRSGMDFLRDNPLDTGCLSCRLLGETDATGAPLPRTFGLAYFASLKHLEEWARNHPSHLRIFNRFIAMAGQLGGDIKLRLWHEVAVLPTQGQVFEYINCHPATGLLAHARPDAYPTSHDSGVQV
ncbi:hypothetical protein BK634_13580 [Pseudomonas chlororaphis]|nr:hypothetical protein BK634_13580 [Pseudomonas chlororaphis]